MQMCSSCWLINAEQTQQMLVCMHLTQSWAPAHHAEPAKVNVCYPVPVQCCAREAIVCIDAVLPLLFSHCFSLM